jgi:two-component system KDP operon response regulator KdpE
MPTLKNRGKLARVLVVGEEEATLRYLRKALDIGEFYLHQADNGHAALHTAEAVQPDIILLDLSVSDQDMIVFIRRIREGSQVPIIVLSEQGGEDDKVGALDAGADDYLIKPLAAAELRTRLRVALKRSLQQAPDELLSCRGLEVDLTRRRAAWLGEEVQLNPTEYELLRLMVSHKGKMLTQGQILRQVWGAAGDSRLIWSNRSQCFRLRL